jgi:hypothetical protein
MSVIGGTSDNILVRLALVSGRGLSSVDCKLTSHIELGKLNRWQRSLRREPVPPFYLIRTSNGFFAAGGYALFTAKEARCFLETAFGFVCPPSATLLARQDVPASPW